MVVWAENPRMAAEEAERRGVDFVLSVNETSRVWWWIAIGIGVAVALVVCVGEGSRPRGRKVRLGG